MMTEETKALEGASASTGLRPRALEDTSQRSSEPGSPVSGERDLALRFYEQAFTIRRAEETLLELYAAGEMKGTVHTCVGQEICAVGVVEALDRDRDVIFSSHRAHGHFIAYCDDLDGLIGEVMGRTIGVCSGVGGTQHLHRRNMYTNGVQGGIVPCAAGAALAEKLLGSDAIVTVFLGDGTMGEGAVYESMNIAALWDLPLLLVLENNQYAQTTPVGQAHAGDLASRAATFGIESRSLEARDFHEVHRAATDAVARVRGRQRPFFLVLDTYRLNPHSKGDDTRAPAEIEAAWGRDPVAALRATLPDSEVARIDQIVEERVGTTVERVRAAPLTDWSDFMSRVAP